MLPVSGAVRSVAPMEHMLDLVIKHNTSYRDRAVIFEFLFSLYNVGLISSQHYMEAAYAVQ